MLTSQQRLAGLPQDLAGNTAAVARAIEQGRFEEAGQFLAAAQKRVPEHAEILRLAGILRIAQGRAGDAIMLLSRARARQPTDPFIHYALARAYENANDHDAALAAIRRACEEGPELADGWYTLGRLLFDAGRFEEGIRALRQCLDLAPGHADARSLLATILNLDGCVADAQAQYREVIAQQPGCGAAWWGLATLKPMPLEGDDIARMRGELARADLADHDRVPLGFALAHALERQRDYAAAMAALHAAHAVARRGHPWDAAQFDARIDSVLDAFEHRSPPGADAAGAPVIFVVSLPRSGSTLVEQILASHSQVQGTSELLDLPQLIKAESMRRQRPFPHWVADCGAADWRRLGEAYLARTAHWREQRPRFTDKMTGNWIHVGAIMAMLPAARVVVVRRDPLETCFGSYRYYFNSHGYTHDFGDLAAAWRGFDRACAHWRTLYPDRVREQSYEALQNDADTQIRELLAFCELPFEPGCLNFHATQRRITTPSAAQVREPIRRDTARSVRYGALLDPLRQALGLAPFESGEKA